MATIITTAGGQHSGALGGAVFASSRAGAVLRSRPGRAQPASAAQQTVKKNFALAANLWGQTTPAQRDGWAQFALNNPTTNADGRASSGAGFQEFCRSNAILCWSNPAGVWLPPPSIPQRPVISLLSVAFGGRTTSRVFITVTVHSAPIPLQLTDAIVAWITIYSFTSGFNSTSMRLMLMGANTPPNYGGGGVVNQFVYESFLPQNYIVGKSVRLAARVVVSGAVSALISKEGTVNA